MKTRKLWSSKAKSLETETHKKDRNPLITNHKPWPFEPVVVNFCFLRGRLRRHRTFRVWLTSQRNSKSKTSLKFREKKGPCLAFTSSTKRAISRSSRATTAKKCTKKRDARENWCFANLTLLLFCRPRCRRRKDAGRKKTRAHGGRWEEERKEAKPFPYSYRPPRACYIFRLLLFLLEYPAAVSAEETQHLNHGCAFSVV